MSQRLQQILNTKKQNGEKLLSIFLTAGFPKQTDTVDTIILLADSGVDFIELGIPFSDPTADGPVIQRSSYQALKNGMSLPQVLDMVTEARKSTDIPIILMGYLNPVYQMGTDKFIERTAQVGADGLIIPDWPYEESQPYLEKLNAADIDLIHLIAPNTPMSRIKQIDDISTAFLYCVAYTGVTGQDSRPTPETCRFFDNLNRNLRHPWMIGFGVKNHEQFQLYTQYADGVIIGSAFLQLLEKTPINERKTAVADFVRRIRYVK